MVQNPEKIIQKITYARGFLWAPCYAVGIVARIRGAVALESVEAALKRLKAPYPQLTSRIACPEDGSIWLVNDDEVDLRVEVREKSSPEDWIDVYLEQERVPFEFIRGPLMRFFLLSGAENSDLIVIAPHVICDGYSLAQMMSDLVDFIHAPQQDLPQCKNPPVVSWQTVRHSVFDVFFLRGLARVISRAWPDGKKRLDQQMYEQLHSRYWDRRRNGLKRILFGAEETEGIIARCRENGATMTGALIASFMMAQWNLGIRDPNDDLVISVSVNIRDRMSHSTDHVLGVFSSAVDMKLNPQKKISYWELARSSTQLLRKTINNRSKLLLPLVLNDLEPRIADEMVAAITTDQWDRKLDFLTNFLKFKGETHCLNVSNIGRINHAHSGSSEVLENLIPLPPLVPGASLAISVITFNSKMNIIVKYNRDKFEDAAVMNIIDLAISHLKS